MSAIDFRKLQMSISETLPIQVGNLYNGHAHSPAVCSLVADGSFPTNGNLGWVGAGWCWGHQRGWGHQEWVEDGHFYHHEHRMGLK